MSASTKRGGPCRRGTTHGVDRGGRASDGCLPYFPVGPASATVRSKDEGSEKQVMGGRHVITNGLFAKAGSHRKGAAAGAARRRERRSSHSAARHGRLRLCL